MTDEVDAAMERRIRDSFAKQGLMAHLGARIESVAPGRVVIALPHRAEVTQQNGYIHAGATSAIADSAGTIASRRGSARTVPMPCRNVRRGNAVLVMNITNSVWYPETFRSPDVGRQWNVLRVFGS